MFQDTKYQLNPSETDIVAITPTRFDELNLAPFSHGFEGGSTDLEVIHGGSRGLPARAFERNIAILARLGRHTGNKKPRNPWIYGA